MGKFKLVSLFLLCLLLVSCGFRRPIKVAFIGSITGDSFELGLAAKRGFLMAVDDINEAGGINGRPIDYLLLDDESRLESAYAAVDQAEDQGYTYVVGLMTSSMTPVVNYAMTAHDMLFVSPTMSTGELSNKDDLFVRVLSESPFEAHDHMTVFTQLNDIKKIAIVYDSKNGQYSLPMVTLFTELFIQEGGQVVYTYDVNTTDKNLMPIAENIKASGAEGLLMVTNTDQTSNMVQQLSKINADLVLCTTGWAYNYTMLTMSGAAGEGVYGIVPHYANYQGEAYLDFSQRYQEFFNETPFFCAHLAYDATMVLAQGIETAKDLDVYQVKDAIVNHGIYQGLQADFTINAYGDAERKRHLLTIKDGDFQLIQP